MCRVSDGYVQPVSEPDIVEDIPVPAKKVRPVYGINDLVVITHIIILDDRNGRPVTSIPVARTDRPCRPMFCRSQMLPVNGWV